MAALARRVCTMRRRTKILVHEHSTRRPPDLSESDDRLLNLRFLECFFFRDLCLRFFSSPSLQLLVDDVSDGGGVVCCCFTATDTQRADESICGESKPKPACGTFGGDDGADGLSRPARSRHSRNWRSCTVKACVRTASAAACSVARLRRRGSVGIS